MQFYNDFCTDPSNPDFVNIPHPSELLALPYQTSLSDKSIDRAFVPATQDVFNARVRPSLAIAKRCGNSYSASLFGGIASLLSLIEPHQLLGKRVSLYGFGGGCAASFFALRVQKSPEKISRIMNLAKRLDEIRVASCEEYDMAMEASPRFWPRSWYSTNDFFIIRSARGITTLQIITLKVPSMTFGLGRFISNTSMIVGGGHMLGIL